MSKLAVLLLAAGLTVLADVQADAQKMIADGKYDEAITALDGAFKKDPKSAALKKSLIGAYMAKGDFFMFKAQVPPFRKYPEALRSYRKVTEMDPANAKAKENIKTIEDIYKSMGRPVPQ
jgi:tetratricopeptide (TPR) repeat protein